ncbi:tRNA (adenosine(37)-N6)-threonylcarbamoyltransferase complex ATPase subunit type 1 TsaE [Pseudogracilibacillus sp. SE30717A]|uniref:tRNA (adenosine(37)-N6)-threonylcarbamoyltransferase complex ATPase subunit type 1 TsaE n=1 Tax=Pseudogracilibacillus sp. SE30717A TaxID=3098293 RepID=UPI00300DC174
MNAFEIISKSEKKTKGIAEILASFLHPGDVLTLEGDLGAGKTTFTKGLAKGLSIERAVTSPTFTIIKEYNGRLPLYHMDAYRLEFSDEDIGFEEYFYGDGISVIEWASFIEEYLPMNRLQIKIEHLSSEKRKLSFQPIGTRYEQLVNELQIYQSDLPTDI